MFTKNIVDSMSGVNGKVLTSFLMHSMASIDLYVSDCQEKISQY